jgi:hypothetical protein
MEHIWEEKEKRSTKLDPHPIINRLGQKIDRIKSWRYRKHIKETARTCV